MLDTVLSAGQSEGKGSIVKGKYKKLMVEGQKHNRDEQMSKSRQITKRTGKSAKKNFFYKQQGHLNTNCK